MALDFLKNAYASLEDGYYALLDKIDSVIPIYKIIDPIDKVVPSFAVVLLLVVLAALFGAASFFGVGIPGTTATLAVTVLDSDGSQLPAKAVVSQAALNLERIALLCEGQQSFMEMEREKYNGTDQDD